MVEVNAKGKLNGELRLVQRIAGVDWTSREVECDLLNGYLDVCMYKGVEAKKLTWLFEDSWIQRE